MHAVREDPKRRGLLYAGTELGIYVSFDDGAHWQPLQLNLPTSPIHDLVVKDDDLVVATHGRSFWVLDDLTPLRQVNPDTIQSAMVLYQPQTALRLHYPTEFDRRGPVGDNPPAGAVINYYLKDAPNDEVTLDILDSNGALVRHLSSKEKEGSEQPPEWPDRVEKPKTIPANAGMNRFAWDLRYEKPLEIPGAFYSGDGPQGPLVLPGDYQVKLTVGGKSQTAPLHVVIDPRSKGAEETLPKQFALAMQVRDRITELHTAVNEIRGLKKQIADFHQRFGAEEKLKPALAAADDLTKKASSVEEQLIQVNMKGSEGNLAFPNMLNEAFDTFSHVIEAADTAPTQPQNDVYKLLAGRLETELKKWDAIKTQDVPAVSDLIKKADLPALTVVANAETK